MPAIQSSGVALRKRDGWAYALRVFAFNHIGSPFIWGRTDCHAFCLQAIDVMTGRDDYAVLRGKYSDPKGALRRLRELGDVRVWLANHGLKVVPHQAFGDLVLYERVESEAQWPGVVPALAMGGDRVMLPISDTGFLGIAPMYAVGRVDSVVRVPCLKP